MNCPATPASFNAETVSPPPATALSLPSRVRKPTVFAIAKVAASNGGVSNAPNGPFHTSVLISPSSLLDLDDRLRPDVEDHLVLGDMIDADDARSARAP